MPWLSVATVTASFVAMLGIANLILNWLDVYLVFFGDHPKVEPSTIAAYPI